MNYDRLLQLGGIDREVPPIPGYISKEHLQDEIADINARLDNEERQYEDVFYMGAGNAYTDVLDNSHMKPVNKSMKLSVNVTCTDGDNIILVIADSFRANFLRADMSGTEIPFTETQVTVNEVLYDVLISDNTYQAGTYNIDINQ